MLTELSITQLTMMLVEWVWLHDEMMRQSV